MHKPEFNEKEWKKQLEELVINNQKDVEYSLKRIQELIPQIGSFNVIANISYINNIKAADGYRDYQPNTLPIVAEYISLLCLKQPFHVGELELTDPAKFYASIQEIQTCGLSIVSKVPFIKNFTQKSGINIDLDSMEEIARNFESEEYYVRNPAFDTHHWEIFEDLFSQFNTEIEQYLGFSVSEAIELCCSISDIILDKSKNCITQSIQSSEKKYFDILRYKSSKVPPAEFYPKEILEKVSQLSKKDLKKHFNYQAEFCASVTLGHFYSFTAAELSNFSQIQLTKVQSFLDALSITFQSIENSFWEPQAIHPLKEKPVIYAENRYIVPAPALLDWSLDKLFEETLLNAPKKLPNRYTSVKHDYLIDKSVSSIKEILPDSHFYKECEYSFNGTNGESDGIIVWDDCLFILESKGNRITDSAKRGGVSRVEKHLDEIFKKAYSQGAKTLEYIDSKDFVEFKPKNQKPVSIKSNDFKHKFIIINSFAPLGHIAPLIKKSYSLDFFQGEHYPYIVSIYDILVLRDILDFPSLFPYYIERRSKFFEEKKYRITDEIDVLGNFLNYGLYFGGIDPENEMDTITLPQFLDEFNQYYFYLEGITKKTYPKPSYKLDRKMRRLIDIIENSSVRHRTSATLFLLDLSPQTQKEFISRLEKIKKAVRKDKEVHDFTLVGRHENKKWGITYMTHPDKHFLTRKLKEYCHFKLLQQGADKWIGISDCGLKEYRIDEILIINGG